MEHKTRENRPMATVRGHWPGGQNEQQRRKMNMKKQALSLFLALNLCLGLAVPAALAADTGPAPGTMNYTEVISPRYEDAAAFSEGLAAVKKDGKWGYINAENEVVVPFQYDLAGEFSEGYAVVAQLTDVTFYPSGTETEDGLIGNDQYVYEYDLGFVDLEGNLQWFCRDDGARVTYTFIVWGGEPLEEPSLPVEYCFYNGYVSLPDPEGSDQLLFGTDGRAALDGMTAYGFHPTEGILVTGRSDAGQWDDQHYYNMTTGKEFWVDSSAVPGQWGEAILRPFNQGLAPAALYEDSNRIYASPWGFVDTTGQFVISPAYSDFRILNFNTSYEVFGEGGLAIVRSDANGLRGAINKSGETVIPFRFDYLYSFEGGLAAYEDDGKWGFLDLKGNVVIPARYNRTSGFGALGIAAVSDDGGAYLIDRNGEKIPGSEQINAETYMLENNEILTPEEYVVIEENGRYGYGRIQYTPPMPEEGDLDGWAYGLVAEAIEAGLIPTELQNLYRENITRGEFCVLLVQALETVTGEEIGDLVQQETGRSLTDCLQSYPFHDSTSRAVVAANALGVISGRGGGVFGPYDLITRQEAAAMLSQTARLLGADIDSAPGADYQDGEDIAPYFQYAVNFVTDRGIMSGTGNGRFSPLAAYSREQSYITVYRLYQLAAGESQQPQEPEEDAADAILRLVNEERAREGLPAMTTNDAINDAAQVRAGELQELFDHTRPDGSTCFTALDEAGVRYWTAGENIAAGTATPEGAMEMWMNSEGHRANILNENFDTIGVGRVGNYWVQMFVGS